MNDNQLDDAIALKNEKHKAVAAKYRAANTEKLKARDAIYRAAANSEKIKTQWLSITLLILKNVGNIKQHIWQPRS